jgi:hypothetical protein
VNGKPIMRWVRNRLLFTVYSFFHHALCDDSLRSN